MLTPKDESFLKAAQELGCLTPEQVRECRAAYEAIASTGAKISLTKLLQDKACLTQEQVNKVVAELRTRGVHPNIGPYDVLTRLGSGGSATVYKAMDTRDKRVVALKVLAPALAADGKSVQRFVRGAELAAKVKHANVAQTYEVARDGTRYYIAMEFVQGTSLSAMAQDGRPLPEPDALRYIKQIAEGLAVCHAQGIIHRDVKPSNIIITPAGTAKLLDLGLARATEASQADITMTGHVVGTPHFMSPEQCAASKDVDGRSDIYSLGATLFYALTGRTPFCGENIYDVMKQQSAAQLPNPKQLNPRVSDEAHALIWKMMAKDRRLRPQNMGEVVDGISRIQLIALDAPAETYDLEGSGTVTKELGGGDIGVEMQKLLAAMEAPDASGSLSRTILRRVNLLDQRMAAIRQFLMLWEDYAGYVQRATKGKVFTDADEERFASLQGEIAKEYAGVLPLLLQRERGGKVIGNCKEKMPLAAVASSLATANALQENVQAGAKLLRDFGDFLQYARRRVISQNFVRYTVARYGATSWGKAIAAVLLLGALGGLGYLMVAGPARWFKQRYETPAVTTKPSTASVPISPWAATTTPPGVATAPTSEPAIVIKTGRSDGSPTISLPAVPRAVALGNGWTAYEVIEIKGRAVGVSNPLQLPVVSRQGDTVAFIMVSDVSKNSGGHDDREAIWRREICIADLRARTTKRADLPDGRDVESFGVDGKGNAYVYSFARRIEKGYLEVRFDGEFTKIQQDGAVQSLFSAQRDQLSKVVQFRPTCVNSAGDVLITVGRHRYLRHSDGAVKELGEEGWQGSAWTLTDAGEIYYGIYGRGAGRFAEGRFQKVLDPLPGVDGEDAVVVNSRGDILVGAGKGTVRLYTRGKVVWTLDPPEPETVLRTYCLSEGGDAVVYILNKGILRRDYNTGKVEQIVPERRWAMSGIEVGVIYCSWKCMDDSGAIYAWVNYVDGNAAIVRLKPPAAESTAAAPPSEAAATLTIQPPKDSNTPGSSSGRLDSETVKKRQEESLRAAARNGDAKRRYQIAGYTTTPPDVLAFLATDSDKDVRIKVAQNPHTPAEALQKLALDKEPEVSQEAAASLRRGSGKNGKVADNKFQAALRASARSANSKTRFKIAAIRETPPDVLASLAGDSDKDVRIKVTQNPSTPAEALQQLVLDENPEVSQAAKSALGERNIAPR